MSLLMMSGVTKTFGGLTAVSELDLHVEPGGIHGLIGPNGAGKSTTIGLLSGFLRPDGGRIMFDEHDLTRLDPAAIARLGISRTFQQAAPLVGLSVFENVIVGMHTRFHASLGAVALGLPAAQREARALTASVEALLARFDLGALAETDAKNLTFGQLRFLEIARAVAMEPQIILLDEPAAGLNEPERKRLVGVVRELRDRGIGVLLVDHDVPLVFGLCDRMTVMNFGSVIASGSPEEVRLNPAVIEAYLGQGRSR
jgi:ABC-type branched-subunit amino acid transport system ATPase component